jgi:hypothetical protein
MSGQAEGNGKDTCGVVTTARCPILHVVFDPTKCSIEITGEAPSLFFSKYMLLMAVEKVANDIEAARQPMIELPGGPLPFHKGR